MKRIVLAAAFAALVVGCSSSGKKADGNTPPSGIGNGDCGGTDKACLTGVVASAATVDDANPQGIGDATVSLADGTVLGTTNTQGWYFVKNVPAGQSVSVCFEATSFARRCRNIAAAGGQNVQVSNTGLLDRNAPTGSLDPAVGGTIQLDGATSIWFPPGGACKATGAAPTGTVACSLTPIVGANQQQRDAAPGDFRGQQTGGTVSQLVTGGMMEIVCQDGASAKVNVCSGKTATIRFPVDLATCTNAALHPDTMKSWGYDEIAGVWKEYGTFAKTCGGAADTSFYQGAVNHFSYWNADNPIQTTCATGRVLDPTGAPVLGALVRCDGDTNPTTGYQGPSEAYTGADGKFCVPVRVGSTFNCIARKGAFVSAPKAAGPSGATALSCGSPGCTAIGDFALTDPLARIVLTWNATPRDLDSHLVGADYADVSGNGVNVYYSNRGSLTSVPFVELDTDVTSGFGPEVVSIVHGAKAQRYRYCVDRYSTDVMDISASGGTVDAFLGGGHWHITVPAGSGTARLWRVLEFSMDAAGNAGGVRIINDFVATTTDDDPAACMR
jgi:hypothetical protein